MKNHWSKETKTYHKNSITLNISGGRPRPDFNHERRCRGVVERAQPSSIARLRRDPSGSAVDRRRSPWQKCGTEPRKSSYCVSFPHRKKTAWKVYRLLRARYILTENSWAFQEVRKNSKSCYRVFRETWKFQASLIYLTFDEKICLSLSEMFQECVMD